MPNDIIRSRQNTFIHTSIPLILKQHYICSLKFQAIKHILPIKGFLFRFLALLLLYSVFRLVFILLNGGLFPSLSNSEIVSVFLHGIRFDITAILYLNSLPMLLQIMPFEVKKHSKFDLFQKTLFILFNLFGIIIILTDFAFFPFNMKRLDSEILGLLGALPNLIILYLKSYWHLFVSLIILGIGLNLVYNKTRVFHFTKDNSFTWNSTTYVIILFLMALGFRGGIQHRPIKPVLATHFVSAHNVALVTNSPFTFLYSLFNRRLEKKEYMTEEKANIIFPIKKSISGSVSGDTSKKNVVLIILESFSGACVGHLGAPRSFTPYLDSLSKKSLAFTRAYSNGRRSSQGLVALTAGIPALMDDPFMYSPYLNNRIYGLPNLLKKEGYSSYFFNGSNKDMLGWEEYINTIGFDDYFGKEEYPYPEHSDGHWGIYDHYYLNYFIEQAGSLKEPFFSTLFTLSSHDPFLIPKELREQFNTGLPFGDGYYDALMYSDWALGQFFEKVKHEDWFENTVFILVADHTINASDRSPEKGFTMLNRFMNRLDIYHIPTLLYSPGFIIPGINEKVIQQLDLFNTILDFANYKGAFFSFGESVLRPSEGTAFQYVKGVFQLIEDDYIMVFKEDKAYSLYNYVADPGLKINLIEQNKDLSFSLETKLKAIIQQHNSMLIHNNMRL